MTTTTTTSGVTASAAPEAPPPAPARPLPPLFRARRAGHVNGLTLGVVVLWLSLIVLLPQAWDAYRERGLALAELGQHQRARADLALYLRQAEHAGDREQMAQRLRALGDEGSG